MINSTVIKNSTTLEATMAPNTLGESNEITLRWIPAHCGYEGNELADQLAKRGSNNDRATRIKFPMPRCVCYAALRRKTIVSWIEYYKLSPPKMFNILWRDKFSKDLIRMNKTDLRAATQILTACLNYHPSKLNRSVQPLCPLCEAEYDTVPHLLAKFPMLWQLRVEYFDNRHSLHHCHGHSGQIQPEKDHWLREQNKTSGVLRHWSYVSWQFERSRNSLLPEIGLLCLALRPLPRQLLAFSCEQILLGSERDLFPSAGLLVVHPPSCQEEEVAQVTFWSIVSTGIVCNEYYFGDENSGILRVTASLYIFTFKWLIIRLNDVRCII